MSQKVNLNAVREEVRKKVSKQYAEKISYLQELLCDTRVKYNDTCVKNRQLYAENEELKEKLREYEDWIERLQEFVNMNSDEREQAVKKYREEKEINEAMKMLFDAPFMKYFNTMLI